jgi:hypothetical protein
MATLHKIDQKKQKEYRIALLGLSADQAPSAGVCLTPAEMAELVENTCQSDKNEQFLQHLSVCENCYQEWLTLKEILTKEPETISKSRIFKLKNIAIVGSFLAAAASIAVFLNINYMNTEIESGQIAIISEKPAISKLEAEKPPPKTGIIDDKAKMRPASPLALSPSSPESAPAQKRPKPSPHPRKEALSMDSRQAQNQQTRTFTPREIASGQKGIQARQVDFNLWIEQVEIGCRNHQSSDGFWQEVAEKGCNLQARSGELTSADKEILDQVLRLISERNGNVAERCRNILDLSAIKKKNRSR